MALNHLKVNVKKRQNYQFFYFVTRNSKPWILFVLINMFCIFICLVVGGYNTFMKNVTNFGTHTTTLLHIQNNSKLYLNIFFFAFFF